MVSDVDCRNFHFYEISVRNNFDYAQGNISMIFLLPHNGVSTESYLGKQDGKRLKLFNTNLEGFKPLSGDELEDIDQLLAIVRSVLGSKFAPFGLPQPRSLSPESSRLQENIKPAVSELSGELGSRFPLFKADSDLAEKTAQVLKDNGIHSIGEPLGKGGFGGVYEVRKPSEKPLALKVLEKAIPYSDREGEGLTLNLPRHRKLQIAKAFILRDRLTGNVYYYKVGDRLPSNRGGLEIIATLSRKQKKETIRTLVKRGPLPISKVKGYGRNLVRGVGAMHKEGLVHGDLKPDNLLLPEREGDDRIKIADFGLATKNRNERRQGGTPPYMNPACALVRPENDWYSTGVTLLEMATGSPFSKPEDVKDPSLRDLLYNARTGLITNPGRIQSEAEILNHPFFR